MRGVRLAVDHDRVVAGVRDGRPDRGRSAVGIRRDDGEGRVLGVPVADPDEPLVKLADHPGAGALVPLALAGDDARVRRDAADRDYDHRRDVGAVVDGGDGVDALARRHQGTAFAVHHLQIRHRADMEGVRSGRRRIRRVIRIGNTIHDLIGAEFRKLEHDADALQILIVPRKHPASRRRTIDEEIRVEAGSDLDGHCAGAVSAVHVPAAVHLPWLSRALHRFSSDAAVDTPW